MHQWLPSTTGWCLPVCRANLVNDKNILCCPIVAPAVKVWRRGGSAGGLGNGRAEEAQSWGTCLLAGSIRTPIKAFQSATWQRSRVRWSQVSLGDKTLEREEDDQKWVLQNNKTKCKQDDQNAQRVCGAIWEVVTASYCARSLCIILLYIFRLARQCIGKNKSTGCGKRKSGAPQCS